MASIASYWTSTGAIEGPSMGKDLLNSFVKGRHDDALCQSEEASPTNNNGVAG